MLHEEYVEGSKRGGIGQPKDGFEVLSIPELHQKSSGHMLGLVLRRLHISDSTPAPLKYTSGSEQCREHLTVQSGANRCLGHVFQDILIIQDSGVNVANWPA